MDVNTPISLIVLHSRPYQDSSLIVDAFSEQYGRLSVLAKGARSQNRGSTRNQLQMSAKVEATLVGKGELKRIRQLEMLEPAKSFFGEQFAMACYVSELILRITQPGESYPSIYNQLDISFKALSVKVSSQRYLRELEWLLINELGVAVDFNHDSAGQPILEDQFYFLDRLESFSVCANSDSKQLSFSGRLLKQIAERSFDEPEVLKAMKLLNRELLRPHLGHMPLKSRDLWIQWRNSRKGHQ